MSRHFTILAVVVLSVYVCNLSAQEPTIAPEITPPLLPAPPVTTAPEYIPQSSSAPLWSGETHSVPQTVPPAITYEHPLAYPVEPVALYPRVRVRDERKAHPHGIPTIITVADPRDRSCTVNIEVCLPPCACEKITRNRRGNRVRYDYGQYEILVISRLGVVIVDYDA